MRQIRLPIRWTLLLPGVIFLLWLGLSACGVGKRLTGVDNTIELRQAMEEAGNERIAWRMAKKLDDFDAYRSYLLLFPEGAYVAEACARLQAYESALWEEVRWAADNEKRMRDYLLVKYLDLFPEGARAAEAREQLQSLWESSLWYTARFDSYDAAAGVLEPQASGLVHLDRLLGLVAYLNKFPQGVLKELVAERLARTYIGYEVLPEWGQSDAGEISLDEEMVEEWALALSAGSGLEQAVAGRPSAYLREILQDRSRLNTFDADHNSIPDEIELPELKGEERPLIHYILPGAPGGRHDEETETTPPDEIISSPEEELPTGTRPEEIPETISPETEPEEVWEEASREDVDMALSLEAMSERTAESISQGQFLYDSIPTLVVDEPFFFQLMIISSTDPVAGVVRRGRVSPRRIPITSEMAVNIQPADPNTFTINPLSDDHQPVFPGDTTIWSWNVIPRKSGTHQVAITIDIITTGPTSGEPLKKNITVFNEKVEVKAIEKPVAPVAENTGGDEDTGFGFYPWLLLLLPIAALVFFLFRRGRKEDNAPAALVQPFGKETPEQRNFLLSNRTAILELLNKSEKAIAKGDTRRAIEELEVFFNDQHYAIHQQLLTLAAQFNKYQREFNLGLKPDDSIPNRVNMALLELINRIHEVVDEG